MNSNLNKFFNNYEFHKTFFSELSTSSILKSEQTRSRSRSSQEQGHGQGKGQGI